MDNSANASGDRDNDQPKVDWFIFIAGSALLLTIVIPAAVAPDWTAHKIGIAYDFITQKFGIYYIIAAIATTVFLLSIAVYDNLLRGLALHIDTLSNVLDCLLPLRRYVGTGR